jgi:hypothetical protein
MTSPLLPVPADRRPLPALRTAPLPPQVRQPTKPGLALVRPKRRRPIWPAVLGALVAGNLALYVVTVVQEAGLNRQQADIYTMRQHNLRLRAELARVESPDRVEDQAVQRLNMARPSSALFLPAPPSDGRRIARLPAPSFGVSEAY